MYEASAGSVVYESQNRYLGPSYTVEACRVQCEPIIQQCEITYQSTVQVQADTPEARKLKGLRWDMIKIKEKLQIGPLSDEEKAIIANDRPKD